MTQNLLKSTVPFIEKFKLIFENSLAKIEVGFQNNFTCLYFRQKYMFDANLAKIRLAWTPELKLSKIL